MSKECRDLRKLLQETSNQLKQVLDEKPVLETTDELENDGSQNPEGNPLNPVIFCIAIYFYYIVSYHILLQSLITIPPL